MAIYTQNKKEVNDLFVNFGGSKKRVMKVFGSYNGSKVLLYQYGSTPPTPTEGVFGVEWDGSATTVWTRTDSSASFSDPVPAVNNGTGSSPFDNIMPWSGMQTIEDTDGGTLVAIPKFYYKWTRNGAYMKLQISMTQEEGFLCSPAHSDRGDGYGERDTVYVGRYHCGSSTYKSTTGIKPQVSTTRSAFRASIHNLGSSIWQWDYALVWTIRMLYLVEFADWNSQAKIGYGCGNGTAVENMGSTDDMQYHTGTSASSKTTWGHTQYRNIEDLWGNAYDWCDGIYFSGANVYCMKNPTLFSDTYNGTLISSKVTTGNSIKAWTTPTETGYEYALYPSEVINNVNYVSDSAYCSNRGIPLRVGGNYTRTQSSGLFCTYEATSSSFSDKGTGSRLMKL